MSALLEVEQLDVRYGDMVALSGIDLSVAEGQTLAVLGANGAGKSTLLKAVTGLMPAGAGRVRFDGADLSGVPAHRRVATGIAMVPEGRRLFGSLTVEGTKLYFKIDYYDALERYGSEDPADPAVTTRVLTILLPEEY